MAEKNETLQEKLYQELYKAGLDDVADAVDKLKDDEDVRKYMWGNRGFFDKMYNDEDFAAAPTFSDLVHNDYTGGKLDFDKQFGEDWDKGFNDISLNKVKYEALKAGRDWKDLYNEMRDEATKRERYRIAHGEEEGGWFDSPKAFGRNLAGAYMSLFAPRQQEAIARGEEPSVKDNVLDAAQTSLEMMPWGRGVGLGGKATRYVLSNVTAPLGTEVLDAAAYDAEENPRGEFQVSDVIGGAGVNLAAPVALQFGAKKAKRFVPGLEKVEQFGDINAKSKEDVLNSLNKGQSSLSQKQRTVTRYNKGQSVSREALLNASDFDPEYKKKFDKVKHKLQNDDWKNLTQEEVKMIKSNPELNEWFLAKNMKSNARMLDEEIAKNLATNKYGNAQAEQGKGLTRLGKPGVALQRYIDEKNKDKVKEQQEKKIVNELGTRGLLLGSRESQWEAGFKPNKIPGDETWEAYKQWYFNKYGEMPR